MIRSGLNPSVNEQWDWQQKAQGRTSSPWNLRKHCAYPEIQFEAE
jgi:hypothetical protein